MQGVCADHVVQYDRTGCAGEPGTSVVAVVGEAEHNATRHAVTAKVADDGDHISFGRLLGSVKLSYQDKGES